MTLNWRMTMTTKLESIAQEAESLKTKSPDKYKVNELCGLVAELARETKKVTDADDAHLHEMEERLGGLEGDRADGK